LLNALVNTAAGASWVSIHNGGGVGIGYSQHAGMVVVADGSEESDRRLSRVLTSDPGMGIIRHADAGYPAAINVAERLGVKLPMLSLRETSSAEPRASLSRSKLSASEQATGPLSFPKASPGSAQ